MGGPNTEMSWEFGDAGETLAREWLKSRGYFVMPASWAGNGGAAMLDGESRSHILLDILACKDGLTKWIDVKAKGRATKNQKRGRWETGCALRHFNEYCAVQLETGITGALAFLHAEERRIYLGDLNAIRPESAIWPPPGGQLKPRHAFKEPMIFFRLDDFEWYEMGTWAPVERFVAKAAAPSRVNAWEGKPPSFRQRGLFE